MNPNSRRISSRSLQRSYQAERENNYYDNSKIKKRKKREMYRRRGSLGESQCHQEGRHDFLDLS